MHPVYSDGCHEIHATTKKNNTILEDILKVSGSDSEGDIMNFTMAKGPSGFEREAFYAGWVVVGYWLKKGWTLSQIAHIRESEKPEKVDSTLRLILSEKKSF